MLYLLRFDGFVKLGWTKHWETRAMRGFWHLKHPPELCGKLDDYKVIKLFEGGTEEFEKSIHKSMDGIGEFYPETTLLKLLEMMQGFDEALIPLNIRCHGVKQACCGGRTHECFNCSKIFKRSEHLARHVRNVHNKKMISVTI